MHSAQGFCKVSTSGDAMLVDLAAMMMQEARISERMEEVVSRLGRLEGVASATQQRAEGVAKALHELRHELAEKGALKPEELRAATARDARAMIDEAVTKMLFQMRADQEKRDRDLKWGLGLLVTAGASLFSALNWLSSHTEGVVAALRLWKGGQ